MRFDWWLFFVRLSQHLPKVILKSILFIHNVITSFLKLLLGR